MKKSLKFFFTFLFFLHHTTPIATAQQYVEKQSQTVTNVMLNGGFEQKTSNWVVSGFTPAYVTPISANWIEGISTLQIDATSGDTFQSKLYTVPGKLRGQNCLARFYYKGGDASTTVQILDGDGSQVGQTLTLSPVTESTAGEISFVCPTQAAIDLDPDDGNLQIKFTFASTVTTYVDSFHIGTNDNIGTAAQAKLIHRAGGTPTGGINGASTTVFGTETYDPYNAYNPATGILTVPEDGHICIMAGAQVGGTEGLDQFVSLNVYRNGAIAGIEGATRVTAAGLTSTYAQLNGCHLVARQDEITIRVNTNITTPAFTAGSTNYFTTTLFPANGQVIKTNAIPTNPQVTTYTTGSGTYTVPFGATYLEVEVLGGGGGGAGGGATQPAGGTGGSSTFGTSLLTSAGGVGGGTGSGGAGGAVTINAPAVNNGSAIGGRGGAGGANSAETSYPIGGNGGVSCVGGAGSGGVAGAGAAPAANTGSGGGGGSGGNLATHTGGGGGGSAGCVRAIIPSPLNATYTYAVGAAGTLGAAGTSGFAGVAGSVGRIKVTAYFGAQPAPLYKGSVIAGNGTVVTRINAVRAISAAATATGDDETINATTGSSYTLSLPSAATLPGKIYNVHLVSDTNQLTIDPNGSQTICGRTTIVLKGIRDGISFQSDGTNWIGLYNGCTRTESTLVTGAGGNGSTCTLATCTTTASNSKTWFTSVTRASAGVYTLNIPAAVAAAIPNCACYSYAPGTGQNFCSPGANPSATAVSFNTLNNGGTLQDSQLSIICNWSR